MESKRVGCGAEIDVHSMSTPPLTGSLDGDREKHDNAIDSDACHKASVSEARRRREQQ